MISRKAPERRSVESERSRLGICILAGGLSTRMGRDKALLRIGSLSALSLIRRTARELNLPIRVIRRDVVPRCGPLGGIYTGLTTNRGGAELFLACDMPLVGAPLLRRLIALFEKSGRASFVRLARRPGFPCIVPTGDAPRIAKQIARNRLSVRELATALKAAYLDVRRPDSDQLLNINTPEQLRAARELARARRSKNPASNCL